MDEERADRHRVIVAQMTLALGIFGILPLIAFLVQVDPITLESAWLRLSR